MPASAQREKVVVVGAGPAGALAALYAARAGDDVEVYELRGDLRDPSTTPLNFTKSINLALSERGINSLRDAQCPGLLETILADTIPMHSRMIHGRRKVTNEIFEDSQQYDVHGRFLRAADRAALNKHLLDELERMPNVQLHFNHKLVGADFKRNIAWFEVKSSPASANKGKVDPYSSGGDSSTDADSSKQAREAHQREHPEEVEVSFDFMIGADGAHSSVRYHLMKYARMNYQQDYIDTLWCEFTIQPADPASTIPLPESAKDGFRLSPNHLHIWPSMAMDGPMFIAIPSADKSFTCTLFMPAIHFTQLDDQLSDKRSSTSALIQDHLTIFFETNFPGVVPALITPSDLLSQYKTNPHLPLISIKCTPYHYSSSVIILGDAAHAMVPFYGQGMNAGLEDVRVLFSLLSTHSSRAEALDAYTAQRTPDAHSINDLAMQNYTEMRSSVRSPLYLLRKRVEEALNNWVPSSGFVTQYARVSFSNQRYSEVVKDVAWQGQVLETAASGAAVVAIAGIGWAAWTMPRTGIMDKLRGVLG